MKNKKLKTLEDINPQVISFDRLWIAEKELRAEAVKWEKKEKNEEVKLWIIEFFNLTEEDLK